MTTGPPAIEPIGLQLMRTAKVANQAFDHALGQAGGSLPVWLVLVSVKAAQHGAQRLLAEAVGIEGATLTHHLNRMEAAGLVTRTRNPSNRRVHRVELTESGEATFLHLLGVAIAFDQRLRRGIDENELQETRRVLAQLLKNLTETQTSE